MYQYPFLTFKFTLGLHKFLQTCLKQVFDYFKQFLVFYWWNQVILEKLIHNHYAKIENRGRNRTSSPFLPKTHRISHHSNARQFACSRPGPVLLLYSDNHLNVWLFQKAGIGLSFSLLKCLSLCPLSWTISLWFLNFIFLRFIGIKIASSHCLNIFLKQFYRVKCISKSY